MGNELFQFLEIIIKGLETCGVRYAIGGSIASSHYGEPRSTLDVDIAIHLTHEQTDAFIQFFSNKGLYIFPESVEKAARQGGDFQIIDGNTAFKTDFYATKPSMTPQQQRIFDRAQQRIYDEAGHSAFFMSPEDVILTKLEWYMLGKSDKHLHDIGGIIKTQQKRLDYAYIEAHVDEISARAVWEKLLKAYANWNRDG